MRRLLALAALIVLVGCGSARRDPNTVVFLIESSPANLDPRIGIDVQSERIDALLFDGLVTRDASFHFTPALAVELGTARPSNAHLSSATRCALS
jgi:peptide/nickel transport system substrate-binding protein